MSTISSWLDDIAGPHRGQKIHVAGVPVEEASGAVIMIHGRGATAPGILDLAQLLLQPGVVYLAPQAAPGSWYPYSFLESREANEPGLSSAHAAVDAIVEKLESGGIGPDRIVLLGFSQGACLATDFAALNPRQYGGVVGFSGGLIGDRIERSEYSGSLDGTPVFLGCSDIDPHIPVERVHKTGTVLEQLNANLTATIYPGMGHTINQDEIEQARAIIQQIAGG